jgi:chromate reductase
MYRVKGRHTVADKIVAFAGSLRRGSFNRALLRAAQELAPDGMDIEVIEIGALPFYNADVEAQGDPPSVAAYNDGIPAVLTNAIDWGSRLPGRAPLSGKPVAVMGASPSRIGTARAQLHLRQLLSHVHARTLPPPELLIASAHESFDKSLRLTSESTREVLAKLLQRFGRWIARERAAVEADRRHTVAG